MHTANRLTNAGHYPTISPLLPRPAGTCIALEAAAPATIFQRQSRRSLVAAFDLRRDHLFGDDRCCRELFLGVRDSVEGHHRADWFTRVAAAAARVVHAAVLRLARPPHRAPQADHRVRRAAAGEHAGAADPAAAAVSRRRGVAAADLVHRVLRRPEPRLPSVEQFDGRHRSGGAARSLLRAAYATRERRELSRADRRRTDSRVLRFRRRHVLGFRRRVRDRVPRAFPVGLSPLADSRSAGARCLARVAVAHRSVARASAPPTSCRSRCSSRACSSR